MGADGHVVLISVAEFKERFPDVRAERFGLHERDVLGVPAYVYYWDTNGIEPPWAWGPTYERQDDGSYKQGEPYTEREKEVIKVLDFDGIGQEMTVWT